MGEHQQRDVLSRDVLTTRYEVFVSLEQKDSVTQRHGQEVVSDVFHRTRQTDETTGRNGVSVRRA
jgi:hypothetical protein